MGAWRVVSLQRSCIITDFSGLLRLADSKSEPIYSGNVNKFAFSAVFPEHLEGEKKKKAVLVLTLQGDDGNDMSNHNILTLEGGTRSYN